MTKKRYVAVVGLLVILVVAGFGGPMMIPLATTTTKAKFERIQDGMTFEEVEAILGKKSGNINIGSAMSTARIYWWMNEDKSRITVAFRDGDIVFQGDDILGCKLIAESKAWTASTETVLEKLCRWLRL